MIRSILLCSLLVAIATAAKTGSPEVDSEKSHPIPKSNIENYVKEMDQNDGFKNEFSSLPPPTKQLRPWNHAAKAQNIPKHRYPTAEDNLLTYDETRVVLRKKPDDPYSDFIMANWVDSYKDKKRYIATQCPMETTIGDFYRMVWQYNVHEIVMLASDHDIEKKKCWKYFLNNIGDNITYGQVDIELKRIIQYPDITVRLLAVSGDRNSRVVVHHHFTSWPDMGVPKDPQQLLNVIRKYRYSDTYTRSWPVLVHCVGGVGRTGTFILADSMYDMAENEDTLDFLKHFWLIRNQRISLIEKPEQYALAHRVIATAYQQGLFTKDKKSSDMETREFEFKCNSSDSGSGQSGRVIVAPVQGPSPGVPGERKKINLLIVDPRIAEQDIVIRITTDENRCTA